MTKDQLPTFLAILIPRILSQLVVKKNITEQEAIRLFYNSDVYATLEKEETKLWHLSAETLYELLDEELITGTVLYPEEQ